MNRASILTCALDQFVPTFESATELAMCWAAALAPVVALLTWAALQ